MEKTATKKFVVDATKPDGTMSHAEGEGYILFNKVQQNAIVMTAEGIFSNSNHIAILTCLKTVMGKERFEMALAAMDLQDYIMFKSGEIEGVRE